MIELIIVDLIGPIEHDYALHIESGKLGKSGEGMGDFDSEIDRAVAVVFDAGNLEAVSAVTFEELKCIEMYARLTARDYIDALVFGVDKKNPIAEQVVRIADRRLGLRKRLGSGRIDLGSNRGLRRASDGDHQADSY